MISVYPEYNYGFKWAANKDIWVKGYVYYKNSLYVNSAIINLFKDIDTFTSFKNTIKELNGLFTIIIKKSDRVWLANDNIRTFPLFWSIKNKEIAISDNPEFLSKKLGCKSINNEACSVFLSTGYTLENSTLFKNIKQLQAGQVVELCEDCEVIEDYFNYNISKEEIVASSEQELSHSFDKCFERTFNSIGDRKVAIPLSGGFDSRLIACMAKEFGLTNVLCYTYGNPNNPEIEISKKTAKELNFKWVFIEYNEELINGFEDKPIFNSFYKYSSKYSSQFFLQEYFAVNYLKEKKLIDSDTVFIPGHSGDFLGGSQLLKNGGIKHHSSRKNLSIQLYKNKLITPGQSKKETKTVLKQINNSLNKYYNNDKEFLAYSIFEDWDIKEKLSKIIANSSNVYDFFGYEYRLPYWDIQLVETFRNLPFHHKFGKITFDKVLTERYFKKHAVFYQTDQSDIILKTRIYKLKTIIKLFIPNFIKHKLLHTFDGYNTTLYTTPFIRELENQKLSMNTDPKYLNAITSLWYIHKMNKKNEH